MSVVRVGLAQFDPVVGAIDGNAARIIELIVEAERLGCDLVAFPELAITGYPPEDLLWRSGFVRDVAAALERIAAATSTCTAVVGFVEGTASIRPDAAGRGESASPAHADDRRPVLHNAAAICAGGRHLGTSRKRELPNYSVFDE